MFVVRVLLLIWDMYCDVVWGDGMVPIGIVFGTDRVLDCHKWQMVTVIDLGYYDAG